MKPFYSLCIACCLTFPGSASAQTVQDTVEDVNWIIDIGYRWGYHNAASNLEHWLSGSGRPKSISTNVFATDGAFLNHLRLIHRPRFVEGVKSRLRDGRLRVGRSAVIHYEDSMRASWGSDLYFALGGFTVQSKAKVTVLRRSRNGTYEVRIDWWKSHIFDVYDWDPDDWYVFWDGTWLSGADLTAVEEAGIAKLFELRSPWARIRDTAVTGRMLIRP